VLGFSTAHYTYFCAVRRQNGESIPFPAGKHKTTLAAYHSLLEVCKQAPELGTGFVWNALNESHFRFVTLQACDVDIANPER
jgi:hypothetical protein